MLSITTAPALDRAVHPHRTGVVPADPKGDELPGRRAIGINLPPQQATEPSVLSPQACSRPAPTEVNCPGGGLVLPSLSCPQHSAEPSTLSPQAKYHPVLTEANWPEGGGIMPSAAPPPQHATEPSVRTPQVCLNPELADSNSTFSLPPVWTPLEIPSRLGSGWRCSVGSGSVVDWRPGSGWRCSVGSGSVVYWRPGSGSSCSVGSGSVVDWRPVPPEALRRVGWGSDPLVAVGPISPPLLVGPG